MARITINELQDRIDNPEKLLKQIGVAAQFESQDSFKQQRFGDVKWPRPYARQSPPRINTAAALSLFNEGKENVPAGIKDDKLANMTPGTELRDSISFRVVSDDTVEVGTNIPFADDAHGGGTSVIPVTDTAKKNLGKFLRKEPQFARKMGFLFDKNKITIKSPPRPFLGMTARLQKKIQMLIQRFFDGQP